RRVGERQLEVERQEAAAHVGELHVPAAVDELEVVDPARVGHAARGAAQRVDGGADAARLDEGAEAAVALEDRRQDPVQQPVAGLRVAALEHAQPDAGRGVGRGGLGRGRAGGRASAQGRSHITTVLLPTGSPGTTMRPALIPISSRIRKRFETRSRSSSSENSRSWCGFSGTAPSELCGVESTSTPRGRSTRANEARQASGSAVCSIVSNEVTASKCAAGKGSRHTSAATADRKSVV